jgi:hypothetical protein
MGPGVEVGRNAIARGGLLKLNPIPLTAQRADAGKHQNPQEYVTKAPGIKTMPKTPGPWC